MLTVESIELERFRGKRQFDKFPSLIDSAKRVVTYELFKSKKAISWFSKDRTLCGKSSVRTNGQPLSLGTSFHRIASFSFPS